MGRACPTYKANHNAKIRLSECSKRSSNSHHKITARLIKDSSIGELTFRHRQGQRTDTCQHVTSLDHFCGAGYLCIIQKKKKDSSITWLGCKDLGPLTFLDFSNCGEIFVIDPKLPMKDNLVKTYIKRFLNIL